MNSKSKKELPSWNCSDDDEKEDGVGSMESEETWWKKIEKRKRETTKDKEEGGSKSNKKRKSVKSSSSSSSDEKSSKKKRHHHKSRKNDNHSRTTTDESLNEDTIQHPSLPNNVGTSLKNPILINNDDSRLAMTLLSSNKLVSSQIARLPSVPANAHGNSVHVPSKMQLDYLKNATDPMDVSSEHYVNLETVNTSTNNSMQKSIFAQSDVDHSSTLTTLNSGQVVSTANEGDKYIPTIMMLPMLDNNNNNNNNLSPPLSPSILGPLLLDNQNQTTIVPLSTNQQQEVLESDSWINEMEARLDYDPLRQYRYQPPTVDQMKARDSQTKQHLQNYEQQLHNDEQKQAFAGIGEWSEKVNRDIEASKHSNSSKSNKFSAEQEEVLRKYREKFSDLSKQQNDILTTFSRVESQLKERNRELKALISGESKIEVDDIKSIEDQLRKIANGEKMIGKLNEESKDLSKVMIAVNKNFTHELTSVKNQKLKIVAKEALKSSGGGIGLPPKEQFEAMAKLDIITRTRDQAITLLKENSKQQEADRLLIQELQMVIEEQQKHIDNPSIDTQKMNENAHKYEDCVVSIAKAMANEISMILSKGMSEIGATSEQYSSHLISELSSGRYLSQGTTSSSGDNPSSSIPLAMSIRNAAKELVEKNKHSFNDISTKTRSFLSSQQ